ncbi:MAG: hypothetical protein ACK5HY_11120 [Parahaliea sp.]
MPERNGIQPITGADVEAVAVFLNRHMNSRFAVAEWAAGLNPAWSRNAPNHGFMLLAEGEVVGAICAMYSQQEIDGVAQAFCNPHSWCVLESHRKSSVPLVLSLIRQPGYHFTMFSPNREGEEIFSYLGFKPLDRARLVLPHLPSVRSGGQCEIITDPERAEASLPPSLARIYRDHRSYPWLQQLVFRKAEHFGLAIFKLSRYKRLPCAGLNYISDRQLFGECWGAISNHLLFRRGIAVSRVEERLLGRRPALAFTTLPGSAKFYLSNSLQHGDINYIYSELFVMDL